MASKKPAAKPAKKTKQKITAKLAPRTRSPKKKAARKAKPSTVKRYDARKPKREAWAAKNPGMIPGELGKPARPEVTPDEILEKASKQAKELGLSDSQDPDETVPGPGDVKTAIEVADEAKFDDKMSAEVKPVEKPE